MKSPGITVKPIIVLDGAHEVNEVFFDNVKVPVENRVGEENKGWTYAKFLLVQRTFRHRRRGALQEGRRAAEGNRRRRTDRRHAADRSDDDFASKIAELEIDLAALEFTELRTLAEEVQGRVWRDRKARSSRFAGTEIQQRITELTVEAIGYYAYPNERSSRRQRVQSVRTMRSARPGHYFNMRKASIYGGSNEIQRNIIAKAVLGL